jgi:hypothetical protein
MVPPLDLIFFVPLPIHKATEMPKLKVNPIKGLGLQSSPINVEKTGIFEA